MQRFQYQRPGVAEGAEPSLRVVGLDVGNLIPGALEDDHATSGRDDVALRGDFVPVGEFGNEAVGERGTMMGVLWVVPVFGPTRRTRVNGPRPEPAMRIVARLTVS